MYSANPIQQLETNSKFEIILFSLGGAMDNVLFGTLSYNSVILGIAWTNGQLPPTPPSTNWISYSSSSLTVVGVTK